MKKLTKYRKTIRNKIFQIAGAGALLALFAGSALAVVITPIPVSYTHLTLPTITE